MVVIGISQFGSTTHAKITGDDPRKSIVEPSQLMTSFERNPDLAKTARTQIITSKGEIRVKYVKKRYLKIVTVQIISAKKCPYDSVVATTH